MLLTSIKLAFVIKIFILSIFEWLFHTGFTVLIQSCVSITDTLSVKNVPLCPTKIKETKNK